MRLSVILEKQARVSVNLDDKAGIEKFKDILAVLFGTEKVKTVETITPTKVELPVETSDKAPETPEERIRKGLAMLKCEGCDTTVAALFYEDQANITCKICGEENKIENLTPAAYECPNCGTRASFFVKDGLNLVRCKTCESDIDLIYHEKKGRYVSPNMIRK